MVQLINTLPKELCLGGMTCESTGAQNLVSTCHRIPDQ